MNKKHEKMHPFAVGFFEVNFKNLEENILKIQEKNKQINNKIKYLLPVKGGGYGCGMIEISKFVQEKKSVDYLGVAHLQEAFELRKSGIHLPILVLGQTQYSEKFLDFIAKENIEIAISEIETFLKIEEYFKKYLDKNNQKISVHIKIDLGMGRCGVLEKDFFELFKKIQNSNFIQIKGVMMHFPVSDSDISDKKNFEYTEFQIQKFSKIKQKIKNICENSKNIIFHTSNSGGATEHKNSVFDMIRPGIASYGYPEPGSGAENLGLKPVVKIYSYFTLLKKFPKNFSIGYGRTYFTKQPNEIIGILPVGYADGLNRLLSNKYSVFSEQKNEYKCVGRISMDQSAYLISDNIDVKELQQQKIYILNENQNAREIAQKLNTISYEVLIRFGTSERLRKIYLYE